MPTDRVRRIVVGVTPEGRSAVVADAQDVASTAPLPGYVVEELWHQRSLPARVDDPGVTVEQIDIEPPPEGALVRVLTIHPVSGGDWTPNPHGDTNRHVLTLVSGTVDLVLEEMDVTLSPRDTVVLSGHVHDWRNTCPTPRGVGRPVSVVATRGSVTRCAATADEPCRAMRTRRWPGGGPSR